MIKSLLTTTILSGVLFAGATSTAKAQFGIKIPKLPKAEKPAEPTRKADEPKPQSPSQPGGNDSPASAAKTGGFPELKRTEPTSTPRFMPETIEVKVKSDSRYWKFPNQDDYTSWLPQVTFDVFFDDSVKLRYNAEWFNPDGTSWYSEPLDYTSFSSDGTGHFASPYSGDLFATKATVATGTYSFKITNTKTGEVVYQGKFKVAKLALFPGDAKLKNRNLFYVDNDWNLSVGYVGLEYSGGTSWDLEPRPFVYLWFKGNLESKDFEARLFKDGQEVASTDDGGSITNDSVRGDDCFANVDLCKYVQWRFNWDNFIIENNTWVREKYPKATMTRDKPGEYVVKIFLRGQQVRETRFTIDNNGWVAPNALSPVLFTPNKIVVPVKVTGGNEKWNPAAWKTDAFYGNPPSGLNVP